MRDASDQVRSGDVVSESRDPRFAELDAQIEAEKAAREQTPAPTPKRRRHRGPLLPAVVRKEITLCAQQLRRHRKLFMANPKLKDRAARVLRSLHPPHRRRGRPCLDSVTKAIRLLEKFRRQYPEEKPDQRWKRIYQEAIPGYADMDRERQRGEELLLRQRVRSRRRMHRSGVFARL